MKNKFVATMSHLGGDWLGFFFVAAFLQSRLAYFLIYDSSDTVDAIPRVFAKTKNNIDVVLYSQLSDKIKSIFGQNSEAFFKNIIENKVPRHQIDFCFCSKKCYEFLSNLNKITYYGNRGVGSSVKTNPLHWILPCHLVIAKNGLGGFNTSIKVKDFLLNLWKVQQVN